MKKKLTKLEKYYIIYDAGNSAFTMISVSLFALFFGLITDGKISQSLSDSLWSYAISAITLIAVLIGPVVGSISDFKGMKRPMFLTMSLLAIIGAIILGISMNYILWLILFVIVKVFYNGALMIYDSMLVDVTDEENMNKISTYGYAIGYILSLIPFLAGICVVAFGFQNYNTNEPSMEASLNCPYGYLICFAINSLWYLAFTLPLFKHYKQKHYIEREKGLIKASYKRIFNTFKDAKGNAHIFLFLIAFFFYIDAAYSIIELAVKVAESLGVDQIQALIALVAVQVIAFPASIFILHLNKKFKTEHLILACIIGYLGVTTLACFISQTWMFWLLAVMVGLFQGGIQALSRSYYAKIIPANSSGEYFSLYDAFGKGASFLGTLLFGIINHATGNANLGIIPLVVLVIIGGTLFIISIRSKAKNKLSELVNQENI